MKTKKTPTLRLAALSALAAFSIVSPVARAADHGDAPFVAGDQFADLADIYAFLNPNDNTKVDIIVTFRGFIVAGEAVNFAIYDPTLRYRIEIENTGDAKADKFINVSFSPRIAIAGPAGKEILQIPQPQNATITFENFKDSTGKKIKGEFVAPVTNPSLGGTAPAQTVTDLNVAGTTMRFSAGEVDDPFFFDIPGFARFIADVRNGVANPQNQFNRARDTFAGYNVMSIALEVPASFLTGSNGSVIGVSAASQRHVVSKIGKPGKLPKGTGSFKTIDREGVPAVNVALVPFNRKNEYNQSTTQDDANLKFGGDILAVLAALGTNGATVFPPTGNALVLAQVAVLNGDILRLETNAVTAPNTGTGGGTGANGFPNGRRLKDDVVDILLTLINNSNALGDNVNASDVAPNDTFPFVHQSQQPFATGTTDDNTRN